MRLRNWTGGILGAVAVAGLLTFANIAAVNSTGSLTEPSPQETSAVQNAPFGDKPYCTTQAAAIPKGTDLSPSGIGSAETQAVLAAAGATPESNCFATQEEARQFIEGK